MLKRFTLFNLEGTETSEPKQLGIPNGGLAQLGERLPCKQEVTGSIPVLSTIEVKYMGQWLSWLEHTTDNREVDGSSPFWPTTSKRD